MTGRPDKSGVISPSSTSLPCVGTLIHGWSFSRGLQQNRNEYEETKICGVEKIRETTYSRCWLGRLTASPFSWHTESHARAVKLKQEKPLFLYIQKSNTNEFIWFNLLYMALSSHLSSKSDSLSWEFEIWVRRSSEFCHLNETTPERFQKLPLPKTQDSCLPKA